MAVRRAPLILLGASLVVLPGRLRGAPEEVRPALLPDLASLLFLEPAQPPGQPPATPLAPPQAQGPDAGRRLTELYGDAQFIFLSGFVSARELTLEGDRFSFSDLNADFGEKLGGGVRFNISDADNLDLHGSYFYLRGSTTLDSDRMFNATTLQGGTTLDTMPDWLEVRLTYLRRLFELERIHSSFWFLFGIDYHFINWKFSGTIAPGSPGQEPAEDFYRQTFPLPVFGLRYLYEPAPGWSLDVRSDAFRANHWRHWNDEGGPIYTSSTIVDVSGNARWQPLPRLFLEAGYTFTYYTLDETGPEDGNHLLTRQHGPTVAMGVSF